jgi:hypothetical protein
MLWREANSESDYMQHAPRMPESAANLLEAAEMVFVPPTAQIEFWRAVGPHRGAATLAALFAGIAASVYRPSASGCTLAKDREPKWNHSRSVSFASRVRQVGFFARELRINAADTFGNPNNIVPQSHPIQAAGSSVKLDLPPMSVVTAAVRIG